ncbi:MAG: signal peptidase I [Chloroflexota bacterium]|nr:signal peptidase I [Chloroflexota bacterium]
MPYDPAAPDDTPGRSPFDESAAEDDAARQEVLGTSPDVRAPVDAASIPAGERRPEPAGDQPEAPAWQSGPALNRYFDSADSDPYSDVPASLELAYTAADLGLTPGAYDRAIPYGDAARNRRSGSGLRVRRIGRELVETVILALLIFFAVKAVVQNFRVEGSSMEPSLHTEQYLLVNKALFFRVNMDKVHDVLPFVAGDNGQKRHLFRAPRRGDVIVFKYPGDPTRDFIKRVIGVPGDTVEVHDETVYINGSPLTETYIKDRPNYTYAPKTVPPGNYWVLGDNRNNSFDSHAWAGSCSATQQCDFVPEENIIGQAWVSYWPFDTFGFVNNRIVKPSAP